METRTQGGSTTARSDVVGQPWRRRVAIGRQFVTLVWLRSKEDAITLKAAALAFATIMGMVPLLAAFSFVGTRLVDRYQDQLVEFLMTALPYSEVAIAERLELYVQQAEALQGFGLLAFMLIGVGTLHTIEETINRIWRSSDRVTLRGKLVSLALVLFWAPLLIGGILSLLVMARRHETFGLLMRESVLVGALPFLIIALGLAMLYWQVPRVRVELRWALAGGVLVALFLEMLRRPFAYYVANINQLSLVYGSFAITLLFMISVQIAWWSVLVGAEVAYVGQHFESLRRGRRIDPRAQGPWVGLAALMYLARSLRRGEPLVQMEEMAVGLGLPPAILDHSLEPLAEHGLVVSTERGWALARDAHGLLIEEVLRSHDGPVDVMLASGRGEEWRRLQELRESLRQSRAPGTRKVFLADLLDETTDDDVAGDEL